MLEGGAASDAAAFRQRSAARRMLASCRATSYLSCSVAEGRREVDDGQVGENWGLNRGGPDRPGWMAAQEEKATRSASPAIPSCRQRQSARAGVGPLGFSGQRWWPPTQLGPPSTFSSLVQQVHWTDAWTPTTTPRRLPHLVPACESTRQRDAVPRPRESQAVSIWKSETRPGLKEPGTYLSCRFTDGRRPRFPSWAPAQRDSQSWP